MPIQLTTAQQQFMQTDNQVRELAIWTLRAQNHVASYVRDAAGIGNSTPEGVLPVPRPTQRQVNAMTIYLATRVSPTILVRLINGLLQEQQ